MAERTTWKVDLAGGIATQYVVLGRTPFEAASRGWRLDQDHQSHAERRSILVQVAGTFEDVENDIPQNAEDELRAQVTALTTRVTTLESRSSTSTR
jgi:hypothetical protein